MLEIKTSKLHMKKSTEVQKIEEGWCCSDDRLNDAPEICNETVYQPFNTSGDVDFGRIDI